MSALALFAMAVPATIGLAWLVGQWLKASEAAAWREADRKAREDMKQHGMERDAFGNWRSIKKDKPQ